MNTNIKGVKDSAENQLLWLKMLTSPQRIAIVKVLGIGRENMLAPSPWSSSQLLPKEL